MYMEYMPLIYLFLNLNLLYPFKRKNVYLCGCILM